MKQQTLAMAADQGAGFEQYRRRTKREFLLHRSRCIRFLDEICSDKFLPLPAWVLVQDIQETNERTHYVARRFEILRAERFIRPLQNGDKRIVGDQILGCVTGCDVAGDHTAMTGRAGGLPIWRGGVLLGGIGIGSGTGAQDIEVAEAALAAIGASATP